MRTHSSTVFKTIVSFSLLGLSACFDSGATPPEANAPCTSNDNCAPGYLCLPPTHGGASLLCCKDANSCGVSGSGGSGGAWDGPASPLDGTVVDSARIDVAVDVASTGGATVDAGAGGAIDGNGLGGITGRGGTGGAGIGGSGGTLAGGSGGIIVGGAGGIVLGGAGGGIDAPVDVPPAPTDAPLLALGKPCTANTDCLGGACVGNATGTAKVCCAAACAGACQACAADGSMCTTKNAGVADSACGDAGTCHTGTCAAGGACAVSPPGTNCGTNLYCTAAGTCSCQAGGSCQPLNVCKTGAYSCATGTAVCAESGNQPATLVCGTSQTCVGSTKYLAQKCDGNGNCPAQQAQACPTNQTCSGTDCACLAPYASCSSGCVNTSTDGANCGTCGKSCGTGGACVGGKCQPIVMTSGLPGYSFVFGVDQSYVYYNDCTGYYDCVPKRIPVSAVGGTGSTFATTPSGASGFGVIGSTALLFLNMQGSFVCNFGTTCALSDSTRLKDGIFSGFKSPAPPYFSLSSSQNTYSEITTWYTTANAVYASYVWSWSSDCPSGIGPFAAVGNSVYWACSNSGNNTVWGTVGFPPSATKQFAGAMAFFPTIADATATSLIFMDNANSLYRVPLPGGLATTPPQKIITGTGTKFITEDANGIYWIDTTGNLNRCTAPSCSSNTVMATGQILGEYFTANNVSGALYQDTGYLYWINGFGQLLKLAK